MIAIVPCGMGNAYAVQKALDALRVANRVSKEPQRILQSDGVILTGTGPFHRAMRDLAAARLDETLWTVALRGMPLLGIGLGMQLLFSESEEGGLHRGLNLLPGLVRRLPSDVKGPHIGWNALAVAQMHPLLGKLGQGYVYFSHLYCVEAVNAEDVLATASYGGDIVAMAGRNRLYGMQFHPEKSGKTGLELLRNFSAECVGKR